MELRHWVVPDSSGRAPKGRIGVENRELCYTTPSQDFETFESEHEGYTGNAGNTVDHWYHRAAVVLMQRLERPRRKNSGGSRRWPNGFSETSTSSAARHRCIAWERRCPRAWQILMPRAFLSVTRWRGVVRNSRGFEQTICPPVLPDLLVLLVLPVPAASLSHNAASCKP